MIAGSSGEFFNRHPATLRPTLEAEFRKLNAFGSAEEIPWKRLVEGNMAQEEFPLDFERIVVGLLVWNFRPAFEEIDGLWNIGIPGRARCVAVVLNPDITETTNGGAFFTIDLDGEKVVTAHTGDP